MLKDTIISAFNYDGTLLKWLKKVEKALQDDTLTNIEVVTNSDYSMQLKLTFGDGTFILSPAFTNKGRGIVSITKTATSGLVDTYTVTYTDNTTSTFTVTNAEGLNANNLFATLTEGIGIELTNDGQSVTIAAKPLISEIVDSHGRKRFLEGAITKEQEFESHEVYAKWSLSGTHLLIVLSIESANDGESLEVPQGYIYSLANLPTWILNKAIGLWGNNIVQKNFSVYHTPNGSISLRLQRLSNQLVIYSEINNIFTAQASTVKPIFRAEFDLLIDTD